MNQIQSWKNNGDSFLSFNMIESSINLEIEKFFWQPLVDKFYMYTLDRCSSLKLNQFLLTLCVSKRVILFDFLCENLFSNAFWLPSNLIFVILGICERQRWRIWSYWIRWKIFWGYTTKKELHPTNPPAWMCVFSHFLLHAQNWKKISTKILVKIQN